MEPRLRLPPDWEHHPELVQALQVLVKGAVRSLRVPAEPGRPGTREKEKQREGRLR